MDKTRITPPKTDFRWLWITLSILAIIIISFNLGKQTNIVANSLGVKKVGVVEITGPIISSKKIIEDLNQLEEKEDIASIVLRIDSPGGSIAPTEEIYEKIKKVKKIKPVIASVGNVAASGGYYIAVAADSIFANKGSILGSIGVIISYPIMKDLFDKVGIDVETIKSGNLKDSGSFSRNPTPQDKIFFEKLILNMYDQFIDVIVKDRMIISDGFNGTPTGFESPCEDEENYTKWYVLHAEANAITKVASSTASAKGATLYITMSPCKECSKLIHQVGIKKLIYINEYKDRSGLDFLIKAGVEVLQMDID